MLPAARAKTTFLRTVPLRKCMMLAGILVKKLNIASLPTAIIGGMRRPKMSMGSSNTPPPSPVNPISVPTMKPISIFASNNSMLFFDAIAQTSRPTTPAFPFSYALPLTPMKPSRSRCRMMVCAASSGLSWAVSMTTSAFVGAS